MLLAVNYSPQAAALVERGAVEVDGFKCPPWPGLIAEARALRPAFVHFDAHAGGAPLAPAALEEMARLRRATGTRYVNLHLAPRRADLEAATDEGARRRLARERALASLEAAVDRFGAGRVMVENVPWERRPDFEIDRVAVEPGLMRELLEASGARLLLDLAHARFAALELGCEARELIEPLPLDRLAELHVTGIGRDPDGRRRDHMPMRDEDFELLGWALAEIAAGRWRRPWALVLEYGGVGPIFAWRSEEDVLARQLPRLAEMMAGLG